MSNGKKKDPEIELTNRVMVLCYAANSVVSAWHIPLFHPAFAKEPELQNRIFCLLICGLMDSGWEYKTRVAGIRAEAKRLGSLSSNYYLDVFSTYIALIVDLLEQIKREEIVEITEHATSGFMAIGQRSTKKIEPYILRKLAKSFDKRSRGMSIRESSAAMAILQTSS